MGVATYFVISKKFTSSPITQQVSDLNHLQTVLSQIGDVQEALLTEVEKKKKLTQEEFYEVLKTSTNSYTITKETIEHVFRTFDTNNDGVMSKYDIMIFLCGCHSKSSK